MNDDQHRLLSLAGRPPARLTVEQTACLLNCQPHDIPILTRARLLKPLGNPPATGTKYFAAAEILELYQDRAWLARATNALHDHWHTRNTRRQRPAHPGSNGGCEAPGGSHRIGALRRPVAPTPQH